jgi:DNA end-binding protein Ku
MRKGKVAAIAQALLFRRVRTVLVRPHGDGLIATTLNFDYEVRDAKSAFAEVADIKIAGEMLELAKHIIGTKKGKFDPRTFDDRYETAVAQLVKAKLEGRSLPKLKAPVVSKPSDLLEALKMSAGASGTASVPPKAANANPKPTQKKSTVRPAAPKAGVAGTPQRRAS